MAVAPTGFAAAHRFSIKAEMMGTVLPHYLIITNPEDLAGGARSCR